MRKSIAMITLFVFICVANAQKNTNHHSDIKKTITIFFDGIHKGDSAIVSSTLHSSIKIQTTFTNKNGVKSIITGSKKKVLTSIASKNKKDIYFEKLISWNINIDGNLASVWTPYEFYLNGKINHCGANSFQLFNNNGKWEIIYLVDMRRKNNCKNSTK